MPVSPTILWFRQDLRLLDHPAVTAASQRGGPVVPLFILDDDGEGNWSPGAASRWWLHHSLGALSESLASRGSRLILARGASAKVIDALIARTGAGAVYWNRRYEPAVISRDAAIKGALLARGIDARSFNGALLREPHEIKNREGKPFQVFTPFWRHCSSLPLPPAGPKSAPPLPSPPKWPESLALPELELLPTIPWDLGFHKVWEPGEAGATRRLKAFLSGPIERYDDARDRPGEEGSSRLSPHLHFGEISPRRIVAAVEKLSADSGVFPPNKGAGRFLTELGWREFAHHLLYHFPHTPDRPLRAEFERFPWARDPGGRLLKAWQRGCTGYPLVDAAMRQLWTTGWMHNRARMVVASFLVKHLRLSWSVGARWFWDTLVDADLADNTLGWQWSAGCGADAAPYFRIFAPVLQGEKCDARGEYVRRWVPELSRLPDAFLHKPWEAPGEVLARSKVILGDTYPLPIVDHARARAAALEAFRGLRERPSA